MKLIIPEQHVGYYGPDERPVGVFLGLSEEKYFQVKAFSWSYSKEFQKSPAHGQAYLEKEHKLDPDREFFKAVHCLAMEDRKDAIVVKDGTWTPKVKEEIAELKGQGKIVVKKDAYDNALRIADNLKKNEKFVNLLKCSESEVSIFWTCPHSGVYCKARIDLLGSYNGDYVIGDLKNFADLHSEKLMGWQVLDKFYHNQMAFYSMAVQATFGKFPKYHRWIFCEDKAPYAHKIRSCSEDLVNTGWKNMTALLERYKTCQEFDSWPAFDQEDKELELPGKSEN